LIITVLLAISPIGEENAREGPAGFPGGSDPAKRLLVG
jgi:hypothetical protein